MRQPRLAIRPSHPRALRLRDGDAKPSAGRRVRLRPPRLRGVDAKPSLRHQFRLRPPHLHGADLRRPPRLHGALLIPLCLFALLLPGAAAQDAPILRTPDASILDRIALDRVSTPPDGLQAPSPYGVRSVWGVFPDLTQDGPWTTVFVVGTPGSEAGAEPELLRLTLERHANLNPLATWINDELLHVRVWWSRIVGSDLIVDVARGELLYHKMFFFPSDLPPNEPPGSD